MVITGNTKLVDIIHLNYYLIAVINRFGIQLGFGEQKVKDICAQLNIDLMFFLDIVNTFHDKDYFPQKKLQGFSISLIVDYLSKTHHYYLEHEIPEIENLITEMVKKCYPDVKDAALIKKFFSEYKAEIKAHILREEDIVFPYALKMEERYKNLNYLSQDADNNFSILDYKKDHDDLEEKPLDLKNIIIKYLPPPKENYLVIQVIDKLHHLQKDLNDHARIEDKVLIPKIIEIEKKLLKK